MLIAKDTMNKVMNAYFCNGYVRIERSTYDNTGLTMPKELFINLCELKDKTVYKLTFKGYWIAYNEFMRDPTWYV